MKKIVPFITIVLVIGLGIFLWNVRQAERKDVSAYEKWGEERRPFEVQRKKLERELEDLAAEYEADKLPKGTTQLIFTDLNEQIYSVCYPVMQTFEFTGVLALSSTQLPGKEGCMTLEQFHELIEAGWSICIQWDSSDSVNRWWSAMQTSLKDLSLEAGDAIYFPKGSYEASLETRVRQLGFSVIIIEKEENENPLQSQYEDGAGHIGAIGFMTSPPKNWLREAVAQDANITYLVSFQVDDQMYNEASFMGMMQAFDAYRASGDLTIGSVDAARSHFRGRKEGVDPELEAKYQQERAVLESQIAEVEAKLSEIDAQYQ